MFDNLKIAIVHDWILNIGGAERVLKTLHEIFPNATIYTLFYNKKFTDNFIPDAKIKHTFLQKPFNLVKNHKFLLPLIPIAIESIDLSDFDIVISSSVSFSKGVITRPKTLHICYCYSPTRFLWDRNTAYTGKIASILKHFLRIWDRQAAKRPDSFIAISKNIQQRIKKYYQRKSEVIYPPISFPTESELRNRESSVFKQNLKDFVKIRTLVNNHQIPSANFYLIVSRLYPHKDIHIAIEAFKKLGHSLVIIGDGPERENLKKIASKNITFLGELTDEHISSYYKMCKAFIMPQEEDFGLTPIEAMLYGKPVLALRRGGALEYVLEGINGEFFDNPTPEVLADGVRRLNENYKNYSPLVIRKTAEKFSRQKFEERFKELIKSNIKQRIN